MTFFLIVPSIMIICIILVHGVTSQIGLKINLAALALCAVLSFLAVLGAVKLSPIPDKHFFLYLGALILISSLLVTALNAFLTKREREEELNFTEEARRVYAQNADKTPAKTFSETLATADEKFKKSSAQIDEDFETLDELLKYAKTQQLRGNIDAAIDAYNLALEDFPDENYAPFVAVDLGAIYREQAAYTNVIKVYEDALELPAVKKNPEVTAEFENKLAYMKTVQSVLLRHRALTTPFSKIPNELLEEIELEFKGNLETDSMVSD